MTNIVTWNTILDRRWLKERIATDLVNLFDEHVPGAFLERMTKGMFGAYRRADKLCRKLLPPSVAKNHIGHARWAQVERMLHRVARDFPERVKVRTPQNSIGSWYYTVLECGKVRLIAVSARSPNAVVEMSEMRQTIAQDNQCYWPFMGLPDIPQDGMLGAYLLHGRDHLDPSRPAFVEVVFPAAGGTKYLGHIDLLDRYGLFYGTATTATPRTSTSLLEAPQIDTSVQHIEEPVVRAKKQRKKREQ